MIIVIKINNYYDFTLIRYTDIGRVFTNKENIA